MAKRKIVDEMGFNIVEDTKTYEMSLERADGQEAQLFEVTFLLDNYQRLTLHVLAEDKVGAQGQATCYTESNDIKWTDASVVRVPLILRGWGGRTF